MRVLFPMGFFLVRGTSLAPDVSLPGVGLGPLGCNFIGSAAHMYARTLGSPRQVPSSTVARPAVTPAGRNDNQPERCSFSQAASSFSSSHTPNAGGLFAPARATCGTLLGLRELGFSPPQTRVKQSMAPNCLRLLHLAHFRDLCSPWSVGVAALASFANPHSLPVAANLPVCQSRRKPRFTAFVHNETYPGRPLGAKGA
jgi:hypothetical protein